MSWLKLLQAKELKILLTDDEEGEDKIVKFNIIYKEVFHNVH